MKILIQFLINPSVIKSFQINDWQKLIEQARSHNLLGRCYYLIQKNALLTLTPDYALWHLESVYKLSQRQKINTFREVDEVIKILKKNDISPTFLKGAAYCILNTHCSQGRIFSDIDVLVTKRELKTTERDFFAGGWLRMQIEDYDDKYYRIWMHEIPPLRHFERASIIDLHHNLLPLTNKNVYEISELTYQEIAHPFFGKAKVLSNEDIVIHSAIHLFTETEFHNGLRDLSDLDMLIREFSQQDKYFIDQLVTKATKIGVIEYVALALRYCFIVFNTPIKNEFTTLNKSVILDFCFKNVFEPKDKNKINFQY